MVGLSDIPCVGKVVERISDAAVDALFRGFRYMFRSKDLVKILDTQVEKANTEEERVSRKVDAELCNGKVIEAHVRKWQKEAEETRESAKELTEKYKNKHSWRCIQCLPIPNPVSRFRLGREAVQKTERLTELINSGEKLLANEIARLASAENLPKSNTEFQNFQSREDVYRELWEALVTGSSPILGIYGMPGVGKTRMMEQIWKEAKEKKIFDKVIRVNVGSENEDVIQLQKQMAGYLDCNFQSEDNVKSRASQLKQSLLNAGKALVVLDDVWREIPLDDIGIPCGDGTSSVGCKILLTSREEEVCLRNKCKNPVKIIPLPVEEAWDQFRNIIGTSQINSVQDESLAKQVCKKCAGLPLLIHAVGKALQFKTHNSWVDALKQLEKGKFENIPGIDPQVYACVKLSIDKLPDDAKSCLFLCCLFPEDANIRITKLIKLATGSQLVSDGESRVLSMVDTLRSSSLLLDCEENDMTKLHDLIRDVGRSIAARDPKYAFLHVKCGLRLPDNADFGTRKFLRLDLESDNVHIPDDLVCPDLHSLWLKCNNLVQQFSGGLFSMSANLIFLYVEAKWFSSLKLQFSLQSWGKLKTLILDHCDLTHINKTNVGLFPEYLETLCIREGRLPEPLNLSNLKYLRKLDIRAMVVLQFMPNTISSLSSLEELHIPNGFKIWGEGSETNCDDSSAPQKPILVEISQLARLTSLQILLNRSEPFHDTTIFDNLQNFNIRVGVSPKPHYSFYHPFKKSIELYGNRIEVFESLIERAEDVIIVNCDNMEHLARMSQGEIQHSRRTSFSKLTCLEIRNCSALRYLFCHSVAKCLSQLQELTIRGCRVMEAIVMNEGSSNEDIINFSNLKELVLSGMPRLRSFYREKKDVVIPSIQLQPLFHGMVVEFPSLEKLEIGNLEDASDIWERDYDNDNSGSSFCKLKTLWVYSCDKLETVIPVAMLHKLQNLESLSIRYCSSVIIGKGEQEEITDVLVFPKLTVLQLEELPNLISFWCYEANASKVEFPNLVELEISSCGKINLQAIEFGRDDFTCQLNRLEISCDNEIQLPCKWQPRLYNLKRLILSRCWWHELKPVCFRRLEQLEVDNCGFSTLFTCSVFKNLQQLERLEVSNCRLLEGIVEDAVGDETSDTSDNTITLPKLLSISLEHLPNLKSFSRTQSYAFNMPRLRYFCLVGCPRVENFTFLNTNTGLVSVDNDWHQGKRVSDLNDYIKQNVKRESHLCDPSAGELSYISDHELLSESERAEEKHRGE